MKCPGLANWIRRVPGHRPAAWLLVLAWMFAAGLADAQPKAPLRFGVLPMGDVVESRRNWEPLWADVGKEIGLTGWRGIIPGRDRLVPRYIGAVADCPRKTS